MVQHLRPGHFFAHDLFWRALGLVFLLLGPESGRGMGFPAPGVGGESCTWGGNSRPKIKKLLTQITKMCTTLKIIAAMITMMTNT